MISLPHHLDCQLGASGATANVVDGDGGENDDRAAAHRIGAAGGGGPDRQWNEPDAIAGITQTGEQGGQRVLTGRDTADLVEEHCCEPR